MVTSWNVPFLAECSFLYGVATRISTETSTHSTLAHLVNTVLTGQGAQIDTTTAAGRLVFGIFAALAEFERELIRERTLAWLTAARAPRGVVA